MKKKKLPKERNVFVPLMLQNCKAGPHRDKKKEAARRACRMKLKPGWYNQPGFFSLVKSGHEDFESGPSMPPMLFPASIFS